MIVACMKLHFVSLDDEGESLRVAKNFHDGLRNRTLITSRLVMVDIHGELSSVFLPFWHELRCIIYVFKY